MVDIDELANAFELLWIQRAACHVEIEAKMLVIVTPFECPFLCFHNAISLPLFNNVLAKPLNCVADPVKAQVVQTSDAMELLAGVIAEE